MVEWKASRHTRDLKKSWKKSSLLALDCLAMQSDDVIWSAIGNQFCSYKVKYVTPFLCLREARRIFPGQLRRISVETNTTSPASAAGNHVPSRTLGMPPCVNTKVCTHLYHPVSIHFNPFPRGSLPVYEDHRASTLPCTHVGKDQAVKQLHKSIGAGKLAGHVQTAVTGIR
jgi:hypothetical protein